MKYLWHWFVELLRRWGILVREEEYRLDREDVDCREKGSLYSRHRCLFPSSAKQVRDLRAAAGLSQRQVAELWGHRWRRRDGVRLRANSYYVSECEQGRRAPTVSEFAVLKEVAHAS